jgi:hypothetical protein
MPSNSRAPTPLSAPSVDSRPSQPPEPLSNLNVQATAAIGSVVQTLLMGSLGGTSGSGKRYSFFPWSSLSACLLTLIRKPAEDKENEDSPMESYIAHGRSFGRNGDIFNSVNDVVQHGVRLAIVDSDDEQGEETEQ